MPKVSQKYPENIPKVSKSIQKVSQKYPNIIQKVSQKYFKCF